MAGVVAVAGAVSVKLRRGYWSHHMRVEGRARLCRGHVWCLSWRSGGMFKHACRCIDEKGVCVGTLSYTTVYG